MKEFKPVYECESPKHFYELFVKLKTDITSSVSISIRGEMWTNNA